MKKRILTVPLILALGTLLSCSIQNTTTPEKTDTTDTKTTDVIENTDSTSTTTTTDTTPLSNYGVLIPITYNLNGGTNNPLNPDYFEMTEGVTIQAPEKEGYGFTGWLVNGGSEKVSKLTIPASQDASASYNLEATYAALDYKIDLRRFDETKKTYVTSRQTIKFDSEYSLPKLSSSDDTLNFDGWYYNDELIPLTGTWKIASNVTLEAKFKTRIITVNLDGNGVKLENDKLEIAYKGEYSLPILERKNYEFLGWAYNDEIIDSEGTWTIEDVEHETYSNGYVDLSSRKSDKEINLVAKWKLVSTTVNFNLSGGELDDTSLTLDLNSTYTLPTPTRKNYEFKGWSYNGVVVVLEGTWNCNEDEIELVALWEEIKVEVTYVLKNTDSDNFTHTEYVGAATGFVNYNPELDETLEITSWYDENLNVLSEGDEFKSYDPITVYADSYTKGLEFGKLDTNDGSGWAFTSYSIIGYKGTSSYVVIPNDYLGLPVEHIASYVFAYNEVIDTVYMCDNITLTGEMVFRGSTLSNIRFSNNLSKITHSMFRDCKNLEIFNAKRITKIGKTAFSNSAIKEFNVEYFYCDDVEDSAFQNCENLESFDLKGVSTLSYAAFYQSGIKTLYNVNSLKFIDSNAFFNCTELTEFTCPTTLEYIGNSVFRGCKKLSSFTLNSELKYFGKDVLYNTAVTFNTKNNAKYYGCGINDYFLLYSMQDDATYLTIDEDCRIIAGSACNTKSLTSITIPSNVVSIGAYAFSDCASLKTVTIDKNGPLEIIGEYAFENTIIESIELPLYDLRMIGECAFKNTNLINVTCNYTQFYYDVAQIDSVLSCLAFGIDENQWYVYTVSTDFAEKLKNGNKNYIRYVSVLS